MTRNRLRAAQTVGVACLILLSTLAGSGLVAGQQPTTTIDGRHPLATPDAVATYDEEGNVSANLDQLDLTLTVADEDDDVGLDGLRVDARHTYVRIDYDEDIARTVRIYLPAEIVTPRVKQDLDAVDDGPTADLRPTQDREWQAVTVRLDGETDAVWALSREAGAVSSARDWVQDAVGNATGIDVPTIGSGGQWQYVESSEYGPNRSRAFDGNESWTIQYRTTRDGEEQWLPVPDCNDPGDQPACTYETEDQTVLITTTEEPPRVRYKRGADVSSRLDAVINDILTIPSRIMESVGGLFGGS